MTESWDSVMVKTSNQNLFKKSADSPCAAASQLGKRINVASMKLYVSLFTLLRKV